MNLREQEYVLAIAKHQGITKAAQELNISPPSLSIFLSTLERNMGVPLFHRLGKKLRPTEAGAAYLQCAQKMVFLKHQYEMKLTELRDGGSGTLHLGMHRRRTEFLLPAVCREFIIQHPKVQVKLHESSSENLFQLLMQGELDLVIDNQVRCEPSLISIPLYRDCLVAVLPRLHPLANRGVHLPGHMLPWMDLSHLAGETFILQKPDQMVRIYTDKAFAHVGIKPTRVYEIENMETAAQMAAEGLGISFNYYGYIRNFSYPKPIRCFMVGDPEQSIDYFIVHRKDMYMAPFVHDFISILQTQTRQLELYPPPASGNHAH